MPNQQSKLEQHLQEAFTGLEHKELPFPYYISHIMKGLMSNLCIEAKLGANREDKLYFDNLRDDYCHVIDFLMELEKIREEVCQNG